MTDVTGTPVSTMPEVTEIESGDFFYVVHAGASRKTKQAAIIAPALAAAASCLKSSENLADLTSASTARNNLELGTAATASETAFDPAGAANDVRQAAVLLTADQNVGGRKTFNSPIFEPGISFGDPTAATIPIHNLTDATAYNLVGHAAISVEVLPAGVLPPGQAFHAFVHNPSKYNLQISKDSGFLYVLDGSGAYTYEFGPGLPFTTNAVGAYIEWDGTTLTLRVIGGDSPIMGRVKDQTGAIGLRLGIPYLIRPTHDLTVNLDDPFFNFVSHDSSAEWTITNPHGYVLTFHGTLGSYWVKLGTGAWGLVTADTGISNHFCRLTWDGAVWWVRAE